jgi:hypothetical protein
MTSDYHRLRDRRRSADVDLLVAPEDSDQLDRLVSSLGWQERPSALGTSVFTTHSVDFYRDGWPCDLDIHRFYPGFLHSPAEVFETIWTRRIYADFAGVPCPIPDITTATALLALHSLRSLTLSPRYEIELNALCQRIINNEIEFDREDFVNFARSVGATAPLTPFFERLDLMVSAPVSELRSPEFGRWRLSSSRGRSNPHLWLRAIAHARGAQRWEFVRAAVWPTAADIVTAYPGIDPSPRALRALRWRRLLNGLRVLPASLRKLWNSRSSHRAKTME